MQILYSLRPPVIVPFVIFVRPPTNDTFAFFKKNF